jgi:hypothetical protein
VGIQEYFATIWSSFSNTPLPLPIDRKFGRYRPHDLVDPFSFGWGSQDSSRLVPNAPDGSVSNSGNCLAASHKHPIVVDIGFGKNPILIKGLKGPFDLGFGKAQFPGQPNVSDLIAGPGPANCVPNQQAFGCEVAVGNAVVVLEDLDGHQRGILGGTIDWISKQRDWFLQTEFIHDRNESTKW